MVSYLVATQYCTYNQATVTMSSYSAGNLGFYLNGFAYPNGSTVLRTDIGEGDAALLCTCLLYTSPSPRDATLSRMPSSA